MEFSLQEFLILGSCIFVLAAVSSLAWNLFYILVLRPYTIQRFFAGQGINGPSYKVLYGSLKEMKRLEKEGVMKTMDTFSHDIVPRVLASQHAWSKQYGERFVFWDGVAPVLVVTNADMAQQILSNKFGHFEKPKQKPYIRALFGKGIALVNGKEWYKHRRVLNPGFHMDKLKAMTGIMAECTLTMLEEWGNHHTMEIEVNQQFKTLTSEIISHSAFGSSYAEGKEVFQAQGELLRLAVASLADLCIPGLQYLPTKTNRRVWELGRSANNKLLSMINTRIKSDNEGQSVSDDLLEMMLESSKSREGMENHRIDLSLSLHEIINNCKTFFFAGHGTTASLLTWSMFLLSIYPEWQNKLRDEVMEVCCKFVPNAEMIGKLRVMNLVLLETLRLYPAVSQLTRISTKTMNLGGITVPKGTVIALPLTMIHRKKEYWGEDANEFDPMRFSEGTSRAAKHPNAMLPFSLGPRNCIGQNFAMIEAKVVLSMILQRFSFSISPNYKHAPSPGLLQPHFGVPIIFKPIL